MKIRVLSAADVRETITPRHAIDAMRTAFGELSDGRAEVPIRSHIESARGITLLMPAFLGGSGSLGAKIASLFPGNAELGEPTIQGAILLLDGETGRTRALLDGTSLTQIRTAAGSGLATELMADPDADVLAVFGAGAQGQSHIEVLAASRRLREIRIFSPSGTSAQNLAARLRERPETLLPPGETNAPPDVHAVETPSRALAGAGLVVAATTSTRPIFGADDLQIGAHINAVGSYRPDMQEIGADVVARAHVVVDQREAAWEEAGDLIIPVEAGTLSRDVIAAELGELVNGDASCERGEHDFSLFKSVGNAAQDVAIAEATLARAEELGFGSVVPF